MIMETGDVLRRSTRSMAKSDGVTSRFFMNKVKAEKKAPDSEILAEVKLTEESLTDTTSHSSIPSTKISPVRVKPEIKEENEVAIPPSPKKRRINTPKIKIEIKQEAEIGTKDETKVEEIPQAGEEPKYIPVPKNFFEIYEHVKQMRTKVIAPVDTMGCAEIPLTLNTDIELTPRNYRFQLLVSLMLSSQTKDEINYIAMSNMKTYFTEQGYEQGITIDAIRWVDEKKLDQLIYSVGFHTRKASFIKKAAEILASEWDGDVPNTVEGLVALPGVGPKMAFLTLQKAWNLTLGIGVDTHVDRLSKMWRWVKNKKGPEQTRAELESWLPRSLWNEINPELVGFGQSICLPRGRRCDLCTLSKTKLCPNVDRALLKKVAAMTPEERKHMNRTLRFDPEPLIKDMEDLA
ncbi:CYFA0S15e01662g1_1 [Cyberlindnera fabianii]|uniref:Endonuclease III homolog n=1 Tax=Cyberlindnera fabianii TaxID=36022 RepID=A0A061B4G7_CYBFA|nr:CYFA0S15e01662g1_1 [Cyberlindnera fabianii]